MSNDLFDDFKLIVGKFWRKKVSGINPAVMEKGLEYAFVEIFLVVNLRYAFFRYTDGFGNVLELYASHFMFMQSFPYNIDDLVHHVNTVGRGEMEGDFLHDSYSLIVGTVEHRRDRMSREFVTFRRDNESSVRR